VAGGDAAKEAVLDHPLDLGVVVDDDAERLGRGGTAR
jgi:hypothetical protein